MRVAKGTQLQSLVDTGAGDRAEPPLSLQWWRRLSAVERVLVRWSSGGGESNLKTQAMCPESQGCGLGQIACVFTFVVEVTITMQLAHARARLGMQEAEPFRPGEDPI